MKPDITFAQKLKNQDINLCNPYTNIESTIRSELPVKYKYLNLNSSFWLGVLSHQRLLNITHMLILWFPTIHYIINDYLVQLISNFIVNHIINSSYTVGAYPACSTYSLKLCLLISYLCIFYVTFNLYIFVHSLHHQTI